MEAVLPAPGEQATGWDILQWFLETNAEPGMATPTKVRDRDRTQVVRAAEQARGLSLDTPFALDEPLGGIAPAALDYATDFRVRGNRKLTSARYPHGAEQLD